ncbi:MAG TPA: hypothetical protein VH142_09335 [Polyangiaceae bacterium]|nr:hypothetical protein [Polyangiaceae bacterium]
MSQPLPLDEAVRALKRDPTQPVVACVDDLTVEMRTVPVLGPSATPRTIGEALAGVEWHGDETLDELLAFFAEARRQCGSGHVPEL